SQPHPNYSRAETSNKLRHALNAAGPRTCAGIRVDLDGDQYCRDCQHWERVTSPIVLGMPRPTLLVGAQSTPGRNGQTLGEDPLAELRERFRLEGDGLCYYPPPTAAGPAPPIWVCGKLEVIAETRDLDNLNHGWLLAFTDRHGQSQSWAMPLKLLENRREYREVLRDRGLRLNGSAARELQLFLDVAKTEKRARCVDRVGWYHGAYVLPDGVIGSTGEEMLVLQTLDRQSEGYRQRGTLDSWRREIAGRCVGNSRLTVAVSAGFAA